MRRARHTLLYASVVISALALMTIESSIGTFRPSALVTRPVYKINGTVESMARSVRFASDAIRVDALELGRMREEVYRLRLEGVRLRSLEKENGRLRALLELKSREPRFLTAARVIGRGSDRWAQSFVIDRGTDHGVTKDLAVVTEQGLLGRIEATDEEYSTVLLVDDERFGAAVRLEDNRTEAILAGAGRGKCVLKYVPIDEPVTLGEAVLTSGLSFSFPPGLPVGVVTGISDRPEEIFKTVEVTPYVNTSRVEEAVVLSE